MDIKTFRTRLFFISFLAFAIPAGLAGYAAWLDRSLLSDLQGQILLGSAPVAWLLFYITGVVFLPAGIDQGPAGSADLRKKLYSMRLLVLSFIFFAVVFAAFGTALHNHLVPEQPSWLRQALLFVAPVTWFFFYIIAGAMAPVKEEADGTAVREGKDEDGAGTAGDVEEETPGAEEQTPSETSTYVHEEQGPDQDEIREQTVVQVLGLLQREGRLVDFLQEDIEPYEDAQIGAAVREVHRGCRTVLKDALGLTPVLDAKEGTEVEVDEDFDPASIKLVGNVHGEPPFRGVLRHCGWRIEEIRLPSRTGTVNSNVIAPAEVEV